MTMEEIYNNPDKWIKEMEEEADKYFEEMEVDD